MQLTNESREIFVPHILQYRVNDLTEENFGSHSISQKTADLVTFTEKILIKNFIFLCSVYHVATISKF